MEIYKGQCPRKGKPSISLTRAERLYVSKRLMELLGWQEGYLMEFVIADDRASVTVRRSASNHPGARRVAKGQNGGGVIACAGLWGYLRVDARPRRLKYLMPRRDEISLALDGDVP